MAPRKDSFARALADAQKRLERALAEQDRAKRVLAALQSEIPTLLITIAALKHHLDPSGPLPEEIAQVEHSPVSPSPPPNLSPEDLAKWYHDRDLSGVGSIAPARPVAPTVAVSEDDLLPDDFAVGKKE
jgi:hypothetical protein